MVAKRPKYVIINFGTCDNQLRVWD